MSTTDKVIRILTPFISICPLYLPFGVHTNKRKDDQ